MAGQDADNAATFTSSSGNVSSRGRTTGVAWAPASWGTVDERGAAQRTPDLSPVIQQIVGRTGWKSGNAMALIITGTGVRVADAFEGGPAKAPVLHIEYGGGSAPPPPPPPPTGECTPTTVADVGVAAGSDDAEEKSSGSVNLSSSDLELVFDGSNQTVGIRFAGVAVPAGATICKAYVQFQADEATSDATSLTVYGQAADNAAAFTTGSFNVSSRLNTSTAAKVAWSPLAWATVGERGAAQRTPDLKMVIQEIVGRTGWKSGNAMALVITGTGVRVAESFEGGAAKAPVLHIEYR